MHSLAGRISRITNAEEHRQVIFTAVIFIRLRLRVGSRSIQHGWELEGLADIATSLNMKQQESSAVDLTSMVCRRHGAKSHRILLLSMGRILANSPALSEISAITFFLDPCRDIIPRAASRHKLVSPKYSGQYMEG